MNIFKHKLMLAALVLDAVLWSTVASADNIYLRYGDINGDVVGGDYNEAIAIASFQWGLSRQVSFDGLQPEIGKAQSGGVSLSKLLDSSSTRLAMEALIGKGENATIEFTQTTKTTNPEQLYMKLELCNAYVTSLSTSSGGDRPAESLGLAFEAFRLMYFKVNEDGSLSGSFDTDWWNFSTNSAGPC